MVLVTRIYEAKAVRWRLVMFCMFACYARITLIDPIRTSRADRSASADLAFNTPESARPPAALSTPPKSTPARSAAFLAGVNSYNYFKKRGLRTHSGGGPQAPSA